MAGIGEETGWPTQFDVKTGIDTARADCRSSDPIPHVPITTLQTATINRRTSMLVFLMRNRIMHVPIVDLICAASRAATPAVDGVAQ
jgi:hypothetical protein